MTPHFAPALLLLASCASAQELPTPAPPASAVPPAQAGTAPDPRSSGGSRENDLRRAERILREEVPRLEEASRRLAEQAAVLERLARELVERTRNDVRNLLGPDFVERHRTLGEVDPVEVAEIARQAVAPLPALPPLKAPAAPAAPAAPTAPPSEPASTPEPGVAPALAGEELAPEETYRRAKGRLLRSQSKKAAGEAARLRSLAETIPPLSELAPEPMPPDAPASPAEGGPPGAGPAGGIPGHGPRRPSAPSPPKVSPGRLRANEEEIRRLREEVERLRRELERVRPEKDPI